MRYKVGDKIRIIDEIIFKPEIEKTIRNLKTDRVFTIEKCHIRKKLDNYNHYKLKEINFWKFREEYIDLYIPIRSRFEILDII